MAGGTTSRADKQRKIKITKRIAKLAQARSEAAASAKPKSKKTPKLAK
jgi:hypothetical protein